ncbi:MAG: hypothetical protein ABFD59_00255 [Smithella sp.]
MKFAIIAITAFIVGLVWGVGIMNILHDRKYRPLSSSGRTSSNRGKEWLDFSPVVLAHIDNYTIPQWGDKPNDQLHTEWTIDDCMLAIKKYANRAGKNSRGRIEDIRDLLKIAHYSCVAWHKRQGA